MLVFTDYSKILITTKLLTQKIIIMETRFINYTTPLNYPNIISNTAEAKYHLSAHMDDIGEVNLGIFKCTDGKYTLGWFARFITITIVIPVFPIDSYIYSQEPYKIIEENSAFRYNDIDFILLKIEEELEIRKLDVIGSPYLIREYADYQKSSWYVIKVFTQERRKKFLCPMWYEYTYQDLGGYSKEDSIRPIFMKNKETIQKYNIGDISYEFLEIGDTFYFEDCVWKIYKDEDIGIYIDKSPIQMSIEK